MVQTLILVRHGKAVQRTDTENDAERALTDAGCRALKATLPQIVGLIDKTRPIHIWASPLKRACQTADLLATFINAKKVSLHPTLAAGNIEGFLDEIAQCPDQIVVIVGHNPFLEELAECLSNISLPFKTGALASFRLMPSIARGELIWFAQGPQTARWESLYHLEKILRRSGNHVWKARKKFLENSDDEKMLHKLRISIRTMRSLLSFAAPFQRKDWNTALQDNLRLLIHQTSRLRDLDVLCEQVRNLPGEAAAVRSDIALVASLAVETATVSNDSSLEDICLQMRAEERDCVVSALSSHRLHKAAQRVRWSMKGTVMMWRKSVEREGLGEEGLQARFTTLCDAFQSAHANLDFSDALATHSLRKRAKRLRYVADKLSIFFEEDAEAMVQQMTAIQDELGVLCDARASCQIIASIDKKSLSSNAVRELLILEKQEEEYIRDALQNGGKIPSRS